MEDDDFDKADSDLEREEKDKTQGLTGFDKLHV